VAALPATGGEVYVPAGTYPVRKTVRLGNAVTLRGAGAATVLRAADGLNDDLIANRDATGNEDLRVYDLRIEGNRLKQTAGSGIRLSRVRRAVIRGVTVTDCHDSGITILSGSHDVVVDAVTCERNRQDGIRIEGPDTCNVTVCNSTLRGNFWEGIFLRGCPDPADPVAVLTHGPSNVRITNNFIHDHWADDAIKMWGCTEVIIVGNVVEGALEAGVEVKTSQRTIVSDNIFRHVDDGKQGTGNGVAIAVSGHDAVKSTRRDFALVGNILADNTFGIWSEFPHGKNQGGVIVGNLAADNVVAGLGMGQLEYAAAVGNVCLNSGQFRPGPTQDTEGIMVTGSAGSPDTLSGKLTLVGNVVGDARPAPHNLQKLGLCVRAAHGVILSDNWATGSYAADIAVQTDRAATHVHEHNNRTTADLQGSR
jgi:hypothetical protein